MAVTDTIKVNIKGHGHYQLSVAGLDRVITAYLPASVSQLRDEICKTNGAEPREYADLVTVTECLVILGELHGYATN
jgi:hypothetical protein